MTSPTTQTEVLVAGAGPTGLVLALWLKRLGINVRIIDKAAEPGTTSRALGVQARTLELYRQVGLADDVVERGLKFAAVNLWARGDHAARIEFTDIGKGITPFPFILIFPQDQHERLLIEHLRRAGVEVERRTQLVGFEDRGDRVVARIEREGEGESVCEAAYIAGCDSAHSKVREGLGIDFPGGTYERTYYVADVDIHGPVNNHELHIALDDADLVAVFPMKGEHAARFIGTIKHGSGDGQRALTWDDVSAKVVDRMKITVDKVHWFSTYRVHHRVAEHFGRGRAFLLGDAAHIHSPVGGQGMNTGIGDAINLSWKLAAVLRRGASSSLLASYEPERIAFARRLVSTTDRVFTFATKGGAIARHVRLDAAPKIVPRLMRNERVRRYLFRTVSQTLLNYRHGPFSEGKAGAVRGGDRLPWVAPEQSGGTDNFAPLSSLDWQVHVHGDASPELVSACAGNALPLHTFAWRAAAADAGFANGASYLVRPDGYVALADPAASPATLGAYLEKHFGARGVGR